MQLVLRPREGSDRSLHTAGRSALELRYAEMRLLEHLYEVGLLVQRLIVNRAGEQVSQLSDDTFVTACLKRIFRSFSRRNRSV